MTPPNKNKSKNIPKNTKVRKINLSYCLINASHVYIENLILLYLNILYAALFIGGLNLMMF